MKSPPMSDKGNPLDRLTRPGGRPLSDDESIPVLTERLSLPSLDLDVSLPKAPPPAVAATATSGCSSPTAGGRRSACPGHRDTAGPGRGSSACCCAYLHCTSRSDDRSDLQLDPNPGRERDRLGPYRGLDS